MGVNANIARVVDGMERLIRRSSMVVVVLEPIIWMVTSLIVVTSTRMMMMIMMTTTMTMMIKCLLIPTLVAVGDVETTIASNLKQSMLVKRIVIGWGKRKGGNESTATQKDGMMIRLER